MKTLWFLALGALLCAEEADIEVIDEKTGFVSAEMHDGELIVHDRFLQKRLEKEGLAIPESMRPAFEDKERIFINDALFAKVFADIYRNNPSQSKI